MRFAGDRQVETERQRERQQDDLHHRPGEPVEPGAVATSLDDPVPAGDEKRAPIVAAARTGAAIFSAALGRADSS